MRLRSPVFIGSQARRGMIAVVGIIKRDLDRTAGGGSMSLFGDVGFDDSTPINVTGQPNHADGSDLLHTRSRAIGTGPPRSSAVPRVIGAASRLPRELRGNVSAGADLSTGRRGQQDLLHRIGGRAGWIRPRSP